MMIIPMEKKKHTFLQMVLVTGLLLSSVQWFVTDDDPEAVFLDFLMISTVDGDFWINWS